VWYSGKGHVQHWHISGFTIILQYTSVWVGVMAYLFPRRLSYFYLNVISIDGGVFLISNLYKENMYQ